MAEFNSQNLDFFVDFKPPLLRQSTVSEHYCIDDPSFSHKKLRLIGGLPAKKIFALFGIDFDSLSNQNKDPIQYYQKNYPIKFFRSVIRKNYGYERNCQVEMLATYLRTCNVVDPFAEWIRISMLAVRR
jgi:hypothetical protein